MIHNKYDDIINMSRPISRHLKMPLADRAAQFSPFAALNGYQDELEETARTTTTKKSLDEAEKKLLNEKLTYLLENSKNDLKANITFFQNDSTKIGGKYISKIGKILRIDTFNKEIILTDKSRIYIEDICSIEVLE